MISDKYKCIFLHIPKNAGTSIESIISEGENTANLFPDHRTILDLEPFSVKKILHIYETKQQFSTLRRLKYFLQKDKLGNYYRTTNKEKYDNYFKFTIVRNPWSRVYSWYRNVMKSIDHLNKYKVPQDCSFHDFIMNHLETQPALRPQFYWIQDSDGNISIDFIGRFETLEADFNKVAEIINLGNNSLPKMRFTGKSLSYLNAYNSTSKDIIWRKYKKEIEYFNYEFEQ